MHTEGKVIIWRLQQWLLPSGKFLEYLHPTSKLNPPRPEDIAQDVSQEWYSALIETQHALIGHYIANAMKYKHSLESGPSMQITHSRRVMEQLRQARNTQMTQQHTLHTIASAAAWED